MVANGANAAGERLKILFTEGSSLSARQTLYPLAGLHEVNIVDPQRLCLCRFSRLVRRWRRCPSYSKTPEAYVEFLVRHVQQQKYDVLLPTHEQAYLVARFRDQLSQYVHLAVPDFATIERAQSKVGFLRILQHLKLPHPETAVLTSYRELDRAWKFPCFLKLAHGTAGNGVRLAHNIVELREAADDFRRLGAIDERTEFLVQQPAVGEQSTVQAVFQHGRLVGVHCCRTTIIGTGGGNLGRESAHQPQVVADVAALGAYLNWHGALSVEYFFDTATGQPEYYECNPRIGETFNAFLSGVNLPQALVQVSMNRHVERLPDSRPGIRTHSGFMAVMDRAVKGGGRRQLLSTMREIRRHEGVFSGAQDELTRPREDWLSAIPAAWLVARLLVRPAVARDIVRQTVDNYSLPEAAADRIRALPTAVDDLPERDSIRAIQQFASSCAAPPKRRAPLPRRG